MIIFVSNRKGGVGKTVISMILSYHYCLQRKKVLLCDFDYDQADAFYYSTGDDNPRSAEITKSNYKYDIVWISEIEDIKYIIPEMKKYDVIVIDGRPDRYLNALIGRIADIIIIPYCTQADYRMALQFSDVIEKYMKPNSEIVTIKNKVKQGEEGIMYAEEFEEYNPTKTLKYAKCLFKRR